MNRVFIEDTIVALATPPGIGAISVIRVSGSDCFVAAEKIFVGKIKLSRASSHTIHYGKIIDEDALVVDDVLISVFHIPNSFTGEDCVEISTHGNPIIIKKIIELLLKQNIRLAEPGEFTKRAFLNGRIDLTQAEAVADVINSHSEASLRGARNQLDGLLSKKINVLREQLINTSSFVELGLDFAEEDIEFIDNIELLKKINGIISEIDELLATYSFGRMIRDGVNVALVGKPNVGKSSILNYILKESRAIVSHIPGTTRDVIREEVLIGGVLYRLFDTAGIRLSEDEIEKEGVFRSREAVRNADMVLFINDAEHGFSTELYSELEKLTKPKNIIAVMNKMDLVGEGYSVTGVAVSAKTGFGMKDLFVLMIKNALGGNNYSEKTPLVSNLRHYRCLIKSLECLKSALITAKKNLSGEYISVDLRAAAVSLGEIIGEVTTDDILNNVFSKFCIGK